jgi:asparagine synthase (glutamine-hydrolysing)
MNSTPLVLRTTARKMIRARSAEAWTRTLRFATPLLPRRWRASQVGDKLHKLADLIATSPQEVYWGLVSHWPRPGELLGVSEPPARLRQLMQEGSSRSFEEDMMYWDLLTYLPGDILVKVDRASMAVSLESRVPMLDHRVVEFAWRLPLSMRVRNGEGKWLLKQLLYRHVPRQLIDRPKTGFGIPIDSWMRGPLRDWCESLLDEARLREQGFFAAQPIRDKWREHLTGQRNWSYWLWDVLMFQAWWESQRSASPARPHAVAVPVSRAG